MLLTTTAPRTRAHRRTQRIVPSGHRAADSGKTTAQLAREMVGAGMRAVITCVDPKRLPASFAGRPWDGRLLEELPEGVDPCGEVRLPRAACAGARCSSEACMRSLCC
jgi:hypothetical protein